MAYENVTNAIFANTKKDNLDEYLKANVANYLWIYFQNANIVLK